MTEPPPGATPQPAAPISKRAAQGQATREQLIEVATQLFAEHGYEDTSIEQVLAAAGVSRGALYHHFAGKDALFEAVVGAVEHRVLAEVLDATRDAPDAVAALNTAALAWIDMAGDPLIQRIMLLDAPSVLGWEHWQGDAEQPAVAGMRRMLEAISAEGRLAPELVPAFSHMILGALDEMALVIARSDDPDKAMADGRAAVRELLRRLVAP